MTSTVHDICSFQLPFSVGSLDLVVASLARVYEGHFMLCLYQGEFKVE